MAHSLNHQNIQALEIDMFKFHHGFSKVSFLDLFYNYNENNFYSFRSQPNTVESARHFGPVIGNNIPIE